MLASAFASMQETWRTVGEGPCMGASMTPHAEPGDLRQGEAVGGAFGATEAFE